MSVADSHATGGIFVINNDAVPSYSFWLSHVAAYAVGRQLASFKFEALNQRCIQALATWDGTDERIAQEVSHKLENGQSITR